MKRRLFFRISGLATGALFLPAPLLARRATLPDEAALIHQAWLAADDCPAHHEHAEYAEYAVSHQRDENAGRVVSLEHVEAEVPDTSALAQNYPNPFNATTSVPFTLAESGFVTLTVYNLVGQKVAILVNEPLHAGTHRVTWEVQSLATGTYQYVLKAGSFLQARRMVVIK